MKKSVKKVLAALLSVLLFASLFTTTAFAAGPDDADVAAAKEELNAALDNFYGVVAGFHGGAWGGLAATINLAFLTAAKGVTNFYTSTAYESLAAHVDAYAAGLDTFGQNLNDAAEAVVQNILANIP